MKNLCTKNKKNMNIGETIAAQSKAIVQLQQQNSELTSQIVQLTRLLAIANKVHTRPTGNRIDTGIGEIGWSCNGSIDLLELMDLLGKVIKNNGVRDTIRILAMAK